MDFKLILRDGQPLAVPDAAPVTSAIVGQIVPFAGWLLPEGFLWCDGTPFSTLESGGYPDLAAAIGQIYGGNGGGGNTARVLSFTNASSICTVTSGPNFEVGDVFFLVGLTYTFTGFQFPVNAGATNSDFHPIHVVETPTSTTFKWSKFRGGEPYAAIGTGTSGPFSGIYVNHNARTPDLRGRSPFGRDNMGGTDANRLTTVTNDGDILGEDFGSETHLLTAAQSGLPAHSHTVGGGQNSVNRTNTGAATAGVGGGSTGANTAANASQEHNNLPPGQICNFIIRAIP